jgi:hypothetical protein
MVKSTLHVIGLLVAILPAASTHAQSNAPSEPNGGLNVMDWEVTASSSWTNSPTATIPMARFRGLVPLSELLPQTTPDSHIRFLSLAAGTTTRNDKRNQVWSLSILDLLLQRAWWSGSVRFVDLESHTYFSHDRTWFELGTGPGFHVQGPDAAFSFRAMAIGGRRTARIITDDASRLDGTGWHGGVLLQTAARVRNALVLTLHASRTAFSSGNLDLDEIGAGLDVNVSRAWTLNNRLRYVPETGPSGAMDAASTQWTVGLTYRMNRP